MWRKVLRVGNKVAFELIEEVRLATSYTGASLFMSGRKSSSDVLCLINR